MQLGCGVLFLILTVLSCCSGIQVSIEQEGYEVAKGGEITLKCLFEPAREFSNLFLSWDAYPDEAGKPMKTVASYFLNTKVDVSPDYEGRAIMQVDPDRKVSILRLTGVTMKDSRQYQCSVKIPNDDEGTPAATTSLLVLVPPSQPVCGIKGTAEYGHNISLTCKSEEGSPEPSYKWSTYSVDNVPRNFPPRTTEKDGVLSLFNISKDTSGFFICLSTNRIGSANCTLTLSVMPASMNLGSTAIIIGAAVGGVLILGIVVYCCCCRKDKSKEPDEGSPDEMMPLDKDPKDDKSNTKEFKDEEKDVVPKSNYSVGAAGQRSEDDRQSDYSGKGRYDGKGSDVDSQRHQEDRRDQYRGSRDQIDDQRDTYRGSRDRLEDQRDTYRGSRDRLDDRQDHYRGSRDRLDDQRDTYRGSRDRLDDQRDTYRGSRDRLDDQRDTYRGSRDRLDDQRDTYRGSRDRLDDQRDTYRGSRDRLDDRRDQYGGSRDRLDDRRNHYGGSRDHIAYIDDR